MFRRSLGLLGLLALSACSGEAPTSASIDGGSGAAGAGGAAGGGAGGNPGDGGALWEPCALVPGSDLSDAECRVFDLPLEYEHPEGETIGVFVKRVRAVQPSVGQVWFLHGGPGGSGVDDLSYLVGDLLERRQDLDFYTLDHRGVGGSARLDCPAQESELSPGGHSITDAEVADCSAAIQQTWGDDLASITLTNAARDVGTLIERLREPSKQVFVWGGSYGTYLTTRYLHLFADQPSAVILEGIEPPDGSFDHYDTKMNATAQKLMARCDADPACRSHFSDLPWAIAQKVVASFDTGHCPALSASSADVRSFFGAMLFYSPINAYVPAMVHRLERCNDSDVAVVQHFLTKYFASIGFVPDTAGNTGLGGSRALFFQIGLSEMWQKEGSVVPAAVLDAWKSTTMSTGLTVDLADAQAIWPTYPHDAYTWKYPTYAGPLLMLQGELDPATVVEDASSMKDHFAASHQTFAAFSTAAHNVRGGSPALDGSDCGDELMASFLEDPEQTLDLGCLDALEPTNFDGEPAVNSYLLGVSDAWGDGG